MPHHLVPEETKEELMATMVVQEEEEEEEAMGAPMKTMGPNRAGVFIL